MKNTIFWDVAPCGERVASVFRVKRMSELGIALAVTNKPFL
jgi:hypothetical protein